MCSGGGSSSSNPPPVPEPQVLRNPFLDSFTPGSAGGILRSGRASLRIGLGSGRSGRTTSTGAVGGVSNPNQVPTGGSQGTGKFTELTFGEQDRQRNIRKSDAYTKEQKRLAQEKRRKKRAEWEASHTCFIADTLVALADGTSKLIQDVMIGDVLLGKDGAHNTVEAFDHPKLGTRVLYGFNEGVPFVTSEHPFWSDHGWASISPNATREENENLEVGYLKVGDELLTVNGSWYPVTSIQWEAASADTQLYNFKLSGNNSYFADGLLAHNKGGN